MKALGAAVLVIACALGFAPSAAAGDQEYLNRVQDRLTAYSPQQLLAAGRMVCSVTSQGRAAPDAIPVVVAALQTSTSIASEVVTAAIVEMPC